MEADPECPPPTLELSNLELEKTPPTPGGGPPKKEEEEEEEEEGGHPPSPAAPLRPPTPPAPPQIGEKNGLVKLPQDEELGGGSGGDFGGGGTPKFTGLGKEELLKAAGTPPWVKARAILLLLFWGGWLGMLGGAAAIVARAPRCRPLPPQSWWQLGGLYRAPPKAFAGDLQGVSERLEHVAGLGMKGLVLGPLHPQTGGGAPQNLSLGQLDPALGSPQDLTHLLQAAKRRGLEVVVELTPNPQEEQPWGGAARDPQLQEGLKRALGQWLERGVSGIFLDGIEELEPSLLAELRNLTEQSSPSSTPRVLLGGTRLRDPPALQQLLNGSLGGALGGTPLLGPFLEALGDPPGSDLAPQVMKLLHPGTPLGWRVGSPWRHLSTLSPPLAPQRLLLLWTLPGTPVLSYGDELGLGDPHPEELTPMPWDLVDSIQEGDNSSQASLLSLCRLLGSLRGRERSLSLGELEPIPTPLAAAFLRSWDQSERFLVLLNPQGRPLPPPLALGHPNLPPQATLRLSTHRPLPPDPQVELGSLELLPYEGVLLSFPYTP